MDDLLTVDLGLGGKVFDGRFADDPGCVLHPTELEDLLDYAIGQDVNFIDTRVLSSNADAVPVVDRDVRRNSSLRGTASVPATVMKRLRDIVPELASTLPDMKAADLRRGIYEADITATGNGGFFRPHVDDGNPSVRNRSASFVLFFSQCPQPFRGGELCIERERRNNDTLYIFDALKEGRLGRAEIAEVVAPIANRLVVFHSHRLHEVRPVHTDTDAFSASRFTVTGFVRVSERHCQVGGAGMIEGLLGVGRGLGR